MEVLFKIPNNHRHGDNRVKTQNLKKTFYSKAACDDISIVPRAITSLLSRELKHTTLERRQITEHNAWDTRGMDAKKYIFGLEMISIILIGKDRVCQAPTEACHGQNTNVKDIEDYVMKLCNACIVIS